MRHIVVWGQSGGGVFDVCLPVYAQLQSKFSWNGDTKIYHTIGGNVTAYASGGRTRGTGTLSLEIHTRLGLSDFMECVKYGVLAIGGGQFGGVRGVDSIVLPNDGANYHDFQLVYITGAVSTEVLGERLEWFKVSVPVEIGGVAAAGGVPWADVTPYTNWNSTGISFFTNGSIVNEMNLLYSGDVKTTFENFTMNGQEIRKFSSRREFSPSYHNVSGYRSALPKSGNNVSTQFFVYRDDELISDEAGQMIYLPENYETSTDEIIAQWEVTAQSGVVYRFVDTYIYNFTR